MSMVKYQFIYPTNVRRITSGFRPANRNNHHGIDIAESGTHEIFAAADGKVSRSYTSSSYGECIFILHNYEGQEFETVYAHLRKNSRKVKEGDLVKQAQIIGIMGNTGNSSGQHLHFEIHKGRWNADKTNAVDPLIYLEQGPNNITLYTVKSGDTLSSIAADFKTSTDALQGANGIENRNLIYPGQQIVIVDDSYNQEKYHVVVKGDTLWSLSKQYESSVVLIQKWNDLDDADFISPGQILRVK